MACCADRPKRYISKEVHEIPELLERLKKIEDPSQATTYRCSECGQIWHEEWVPVMHASTTVVYKDGMDPDPLRDVDGRQPGWAPPTSPAPDPVGCIGQALPMTLAAAIGLVTLPQGDQAARVNWNLRWMFVGAMGTWVARRWAQRRR